MVRVDQNAVAIVRSVTAVRLESTSRFGSGVDAATRSARLKSLVECYCSVGAALVGRFTRST